MRREQVEFIMSPSRNHRHNVIGMFVLIVVSALLLAVPAGAKPWSQDGFEDCITKEFDKDPKNFDYDLVLEVCCIENGGTATSNGDPGGARCLEAETVKGPSTEEPGGKPPSGVPPQAPDNGRAPTGNQAPILPAAQAPVAG